MAKTAAVRRNSAPPKPFSLPLLPPVPSSSLPPRLLYLQANPPPKPSSFHYNWNHRQQQRGRGKSSVSPPRHHHHQSPGSNAATTTTAAAAAAAAATDFLQLPPDSHIPGYTGHCPTLRDRFGETFATSTCAANMQRKNTTSGNGGAGGACFTQNSRSRQRDSCRDDYFAAGTKSLIRLHPGEREVFPRFKSEPTKAYDDGWNDDFGRLSYGKKSAPESALSSQRILELDRQMLLLSLLPSPRLTPVCSSRGHHLLENLTRHQRLQQRLQRLQRQRQC